MSTVADVISAMRVELNDTGSSRWSDSSLLELVKKSIRMIEPVLYRLGVPFAMKEHTFATVSGTAAYDLPSDFGTPIALYDEDNSVELTQSSLQVYRSTVSAGGSTIWCVKKNTSDEQKIYIKDTPSSAVNMVLDYNPHLDLSAYTTATDMPWNGVLDMLVGDIAKVLAQNVDEMDVTVDAQISAQIEADVMNYFQGQTASIIPGRGWN